MAATFALHGWCRTS
ncbi:trp operon leader peptide [Salmonella enterica]|nr:trp operon leader peptide [Salmonella enterica]EJX2489526.1 trp operon leader peptide [Salmonella enterica]